MWTIGYRAVYAISRARDDTDIDRGRVERTPRGDATGRARRYVVPAREKQVARKRSEGVTHRRKVKVDVALRWDRIELYGTVMVFLSVASRGLDHAGRDFFPPLPWRGAGTVFPRCRSTTP